MRPHVRALAGRPGNAGPARDRGSTQAGRARPRALHPALDRRSGFALGAAIVTAVVLNLAIFSAFERLSIALALFAFYTYPALVAIGSVAIGEEGLDAVASSRSCSRSSG